jgi:peptide/nickel transport system permease protein
MAFREEALPLEVLEVPAPSAWRRWSRTGLTFARRKPLGAFGAVFLLFVVVVAVLSPWIAPYPYTEPHFGEDLQGPSSTYLFGTDNQGRDFFSRVLIGSQVTVLVGLGTVILASVIAVVFGGISGYFGGRTDLVTQRAVDIWVALPPIFLVVTFVSVLGTGGEGFLGLGRGPDVGLKPTTDDEEIWYTFFRSTVVIFSLGLIFAGYGARILRGAVLGIKENVYIDAARSIGATNLRIMLKHVLPNIMPVVIVLASVNLGAAVLAEATVSFLGFGIREPFPTWGGLLATDGRRQGVEQVMLMLAPGAAIFICVYAFNMLGDALRDVLDPRLRGGR